MEGDTLLHVKGRDPARAPFLVAVTKYLASSTLRKGGFLLAQVQAHIPPGWGRQGSRRPAAHTAPTVRGQAPAQSLFLMWSETHPTE